MSEQGTDDPPGDDGAQDPSPDPSPSPDPNPIPDPIPIPAPSPRWSRASKIGAGVILIAGLAALVLLRQRRPATGSHATAGGRAAIHAPAAPSLPGKAEQGIHLTGYVVDGANAPVAGAAISAEPEVAAALGSDAVPSIVVTAPATGPDGRFSLTGLVPGRYRLHVTGSGLLAAEVRYVPVPSDDARIVVARRVTLDGTVTDGGHPVPDAHVGVRGDPLGGTLEVTTDPHGAFHVANLPEGRYQVFAYQGALAARAVRVDRLGAGPFAPVELHLEAAAIVVGRVVDRATGTGLVSAVELRPSDDEQAPRYARTGDDGVFRIEGVPNGTWIADAYAPGYISLGGLELEAGKGVPELALDRGGIIEGRVLDADGHPIAGATIRALATGPTASEASAAVDQDRLRRFSGRTSAPAPEPGVASSDPQLIPRGELGVMIGPIPPIPPPGAAIARAAAVVDPSNAGASLAGDPPPLPVDPIRGAIWTTDRDGRYRVAGLAKSTVHVLALAPGFAEARSKPIKIAPGKVVTGVDIVATPGVFVQGHVVDQHGAPIVGAELTATPEGGAPIDGFSDGNGAFRLGPLAGTVALHASAYGHVDAERELDLPAAHGTQPGEQDVDLELDTADATLAGTVADDRGTPLGGAHVEVVGGAGAGRGAVTAADGTFSIDMLPRGPLRVQVQHPDYPTTTLAASASDAGDRAHLVVPIGGGIDGALLDDTGQPIAGVTLSAAGPEGAQAEATSDAAGRWKLAPLAAGAWTVHVRLPGYLATQRDVDVPVATTPGEASVRDLRIDLARGALVGGTVRDTRGARIAGAHVVVRAADGDGPTVEGDADATGEFRLHDCPTGELVITATSGDASGDARVTARAGDELLGVEVDVQ